MIRTPWSATDYLLAALTIIFAFGAAFTGLQESRRREARAHLIRDLKTIAAAVNAYVRERDVAPPSADAGVMPSGLASYLPKFDWSAPTPVGGRYRLTSITQKESDASIPPRVSLEVTAFPPGPPLTLNPADLESIDRAIDDGNLATGSFRAGFNGWPTLTVNPPP